MTTITTEKLYDIYLKYPKVATDTRKLQSGDLFFALKGGNFNGNAFAAKALEAGASYAIIDEVEYQTDERCLLVDDVLTALQDLARYHRKRRLQCAIIGITGSNGKTTTKELVTAVLSAAYRTQATAGNFNNHIGVPLTLLSFPLDLEMGVVEMGANHHDEINFLCSIAHPHFGIITNIGKAHLEGFGSIEGVARAKGELFEYLEGAQGRAFLNMNDRRIADMGYYLQKASTYGSNKFAKTYGKVVSADPTLTVRWFPRKKQKTDPNIPPIDIKTQLVGAYNLDNVLAAIAIGTHLKVPPQKIREAIENYCPTNNRSQTMQRGSNTFILDAYNANPSSMTAALQNFAKLKATSKVVVLGDMLELGEYSQDEHQKMVDLLQTMDLQVAVLVGNEFGKAQRPSNFYHFDTSTQAAKWFEQQKFSDTHFLIKGSRGIKLEKVLGN